MLLSTLLACGLFGSAAPPGNPAYPPTSLDAAFTACGDDTLCVAVELGCCDSCNGGHAVAVNASSVLEVTTKHRETCVPSTECTEIGCGLLGAVCTDGTCALKNVLPP